MLPFLVSGVVFFVCFVCNKASFTIEIICVFLHNFFFSYLKKYTVHDLDSKIDRVR